jgi:SAM-dependent methyltransferase
VRAKLAEPRIPDIGVEDLLKHSKLLGTDPLLVVEEPSVFDDGVVQHVLDLVRYHRACGSCWTDVAGQGLDRRSTMKQAIRGAPTLFVVVVSAAMTTSCLAGQGSPKQSKAFALERPDYERYGEAGAERFNQVAKRRKLVYTRLAEYLVDSFDLATRSGIGIDLGGGPGDLALGLAARTKRFYWVNADINTWYARPFAQDALKRSLTHRTSFVFADACALPFRDGYADLVVSRGSYQFWGDLETGVREVHRVLRPGGQAFIGRGFPPTMPAAEVKSLRARGVVGGPKYNPDEDAARFRAIMEKLGVQDFEVIRQKPKAPALDYGVWLRFRK